MILFHSGHVFYGPNGQGYVLLTDVSGKDTIHENQFLPFGGAPKPVKGDKIPEWLLNQIRD